MSFLIDTDICSAYLKGNGKVFNKFIQHGGGLHISTVAAGELFTWGYQLPVKPERLRGIQDLLAEVTIVPFDLAIAEMFGIKRAELMEKGINIPQSDMQIAATALVHNLTIVTHNTRHFSLVPGLRLEDWTL